MLVFTVFIVLYATLNAKFNQLVIDGKDWHLWQWFKVALIGIIVSIGSVFKFDNPSEFWKLLFVFVTIYWIVFDLMLNLFRHKKWYYVGETAAIDKLLRSWQFVIKIAMLWFVALILMYYF